MVGPRRRLTRSDLGWLTGQVAVFLLAFVVLPRVDGGPGRLATDAAWTRPVGTGVMVLGGALAAWAMVTLGPQLVPQPTPVDGGDVVVSGPYRFVRHPIYLGVLLLVVGSLTRTPSLAGVVVAVGAAVFLDRKAAHEERLLLARHPDQYGALLQTVPHRVVPSPRPTSRV